MSINDEMQMQIHNLDRSALIPSEWKDQFKSGQLLFNPTIVDRPDGYAMSYRAVSLDTNERRIATCMLSKDLEVVEGSVTGLSDLVEFARSTELNTRSLKWHADPRYHKVGSDLYLTWNDGANRPSNHQFIVKMTEDGLRPAGKARELVLHHMERRSIEKNWMLFEVGGQTFVVYSCSPHIILTADLTNLEEVPCYPTAETHWVNTYSEIFGVMRGGAQPVRRVNRAGLDTFLSITHSSYKLPEGRRYEIAAYEFEAQLPFKVLRSVKRPIDVNTDEIVKFEFPKLNQDVLSVVYPCGFVVEDETAVISYGINDENLAIVKIPMPALDFALLPVKDEKQVLPTTVTFLPRRELASADLFGNKRRPKIPLFWWNTAGKSFDGKLGERRFKIGNFGDIASRDIVERVSGFKSSVPKATGRKLVSTGSVLHTAGQGDIIWGSGVKGTARYVAEGVSHLDIRAVRGPLTLDFLRELKFDVSKVSEVFDPGCLINKLYETEVSAYDVAQNTEMGQFRIVPHYRDDLLMRRTYKSMQHSFIAVDCTPQQMIEGMLGAEAIYSSSLHGIIFAESLGIPAYWLKSIGGEDSYKFYDYYYGTGRYQVKCFETLQDAFRSEAMMLPNFKPDVFLSTFPHDVLEDMAADLEGLRPGAAIKPSLKSAEVVDEIFGWTPSAGRLGSGGFWLIGKQSGFGVRLAIPNGAKIMVKITVRPFNHPALPDPQEIIITIAGQMRYHLRWLYGDTESKNINVLVSDQMLEDNFLTIQSQARHAISPATLKVGSAKDALTVCIEEVSVSNIADRVLNESLTTTMEY